MNDLRFALRQLVKQPGFAAVAILSLTLGIGACTAVFSVANGVLLRSLPVPNPQELRVLRWSGTDARLRSFSGDATQVGNRLVGDAVSPQIFATLRDHGAALAQVFAFAPLDDLVVQARDAASSGRGMVVSDNFFAGLEVRPFLGSLFTPAQAETDPDAGRKVVITHRGWVEHLGRNPDAIGQSITLNGQAVTILGILPAAFPGVRTGDGREFYVLLTPDSPFVLRAATSSEHWWLRLMARLGPGTTDLTLKAALDVGFRPLAEPQMKEPNLRVDPGRSGFAADRDRLRKPLLLMLGAVGLVMIVACVNLAGLSLARGSHRQHEWAIRSALGASYRRLVTQAFAETLLLAGIGGVLGITLSCLITSILSRLLGGADDGLRYDTSLDLRVLAFCVGLALLTAVLSGVLPAMRAGNCDPTQAIKSRRASGAPRLGIGRGLVALQFALSLVLLTGAGLFLRTVVNLRHVDAGFDTEKLLVFAVNPTAAGMDDERLAGFYDRLQERLVAMPGVHDATLLMNPLLDNQTWSGGFSFPHRAAPVSADLHTHRLVVGERYFSTLGISVVLGRSFTAGDRAESPRVVVVNQAFVRRYLPDEVPLGRTIGFLGQHWQIVGVCSDTKYGNLKDPAPPTAYLSFRQFPLRYRTSFAVRTALPPLALAGDVRRALASVHPAIPVSRLVTQEQLRDGNMGQERLLALLGSALAGLALVLSCVGLYALMAYNVVRRTSDIAVRMALGAPPGHVAAAFLREALALGSLGAVLGLPAVFLTARLFENQLYGLRAVDPTTIAFVAGTLLVVTLGAAWLPARRAAGIDPLRALRAE